MSLSEEIRFFFVLDSGVSVAVSFGDCFFDPETRQLFRKGKVVGLSPKAFHLLEILLDRRPKALSKEELQDLIWPGVFVSEGDLAGLITEVREAIGDAVWNRKDRRVEMHLVSRRAQRFRIPRARATVEFAQARGSGPKAPTSTPRFRSWTSAVSPGSARTSSGSRRTPVSR